MTHGRLQAPAVQRNREPILAVLRPLLPAGSRVLEIASGTGEHAAFLAPRLGVTWQPSDPDPTCRRSIAAWAADAGGAVLPPMDIDAGRSGWETPLAAQSFAAAVCINMIHISPWPATLGLLAGAARLLPDGGVLYLYGPYRRRGAHTAPSNAAFDAALQAENPDWGVRDLEAVAAAAAAAGFRHEDTVAMPANNLSVVLRRSDGQ